jgi:hypothetical protein
MSEEQKDVGATASQSLVVEPFVDEWESADCLASGEIRVSPPDLPYPAMVVLELRGPGGDSFEFSMLADDADLLADKLGCASHSANGLMHSLQTTAKRSSPKSGASR